MTDAHPGAPTNPLRPGAPLPEKLDALPPVHLEDLVPEMLRAEVELLYAIARHRKAWKTMRQRAWERDAMIDRPNMLSTLETDPHWKKATGDVSWWRDEMTAQATTLLALRQMMQART